ncbi:MerR family transcriptional regulator [Aureimonas frigidaquae]|uniref:MerR family transcriptional regulator n=1 Tax=Aureimonas frigidaquae TaxID=424757 RepID=UPI000781307F|nr:helix-turn-helix domain-containing protein [Aureimonas frigidaquae]
MRATAREIGQAARESGVKVPTIRYYEEIGLMTAPPRSDGNRRLYDDGHVRRLRFIRHARELGFDIGPIRELLALADRPDQPCADADRIARSHLDAIDDRIARLTALRAEIGRMTDCTHDSIGQCRVIEVLADHDKCMADAH